MSSTNTEKDIIGQYNLFKSLKQFDHNIIVEFIRAMHIKSTAENIEESFEYGVPLKIDNVWHEAILNTVDYHFFCNDHLGKFIHHSTKTVNDDPKLKLDRIFKTIEKYRQIYKEEPLGEIWGLKKMLVEKKLVNVLLIEEDIKVIDEKPEYKIKFKNLSDKIEREVIVRSNYTIFTLMNIIKDLDGIPIVQQRLIHKGKQINETEYNENSNQKTLQDFSIGENSLIHVVFRLAGC